MRMKPSTRPKKRFPWPRLRKPAASSGRPRKKMATPTIAIPIVMRMAPALNSICSPAACTFADHINAFIPRCSCSQRPARPRTSGSFQKGCV